MADELQSKSVAFEGPMLTWHRPVTLSEMLALKKASPEAKIVGGNTEIGKSSHSATITGCSSITALQV
jgi:xanthine dehydrogenase/oxidase